MGYNFKILPPWYRVKADKEYPVICENPWKHKVFKDDVLTKNKNGLFTIHTGICVFGLKIPEKDLIEQTKTANLQLL